MDKLNAVSERWRHKKGGVYEVLSREVSREDVYAGETGFTLYQSDPHLKVITLKFEATDSIRAGEPMVCYRNVDTGKCWVRPASMFRDGRFTKVEEG